MAFHWQGILQFGWIGVQTFFVLSGFLITGILERSKERYKTLDYFFIYLFILLGPLLRLLTQVSMSHIYGSPEAVGNAVYNSPLSHIDAFAAGAAVALALPGFRSRFAQKFFLTAGIALCAGLALLLCCSRNGKAVAPDSLGYPINLPYFYSSVWAYTLINLTSAFLLGVLGTSNLPVFGSGLMQWLGRISYGLYLFHLPVQSLLKPFVTGKPWFAPGSICLFLISILATVLVAWLSYEFWEVHFLKLKGLYKPKAVCCREAATNLGRG